MNLYMLFILSLYFEGLDSLQKFKSRVIIFYVFIFFISGFLQKNANSI